MLRIDACGIFWEWIAYNMRIFFYTLRTLARSYCISLLMNANYSKPKC